MAIFWFLGKNLGCMFIFIFSIIFLFTMFYRKSQNVHIWYGFNFLAPTQMRTGGDIMGKTFYIVFLNVLGRNTIKYTLTDVLMLSAKTCHKTVYLSFQCFFPCLYQNHQPLLAVMTSAKPSTSNIVL